MEMTTATFSRAVRMVFWVSIIFAGVWVFWW